MNDFIDLTKWRSTAESLLNMIITRIQDPLFCLQFAVIAAFGWINHLGARYTSMFSRDGIEIPFPQRDLHLRSMPGEKGLGSLVSALHVGAQT